MRLLIEMRWLRLKEIDEHDLDSPERSVIHKKIIQQKRFLKQLYIDWYAKLKEFSGFHKEGVFIELGSGGGFVKEIMPGIITSDVIPLPDVDIVFSGENMPYKDASVDGIMMIDVFHHIADPGAFLKEVSRVLKPNGTLVMSEPWNATWPRFIFQNFHHEPFDPEGGWGIINNGSLSGANGALPWIVFERDRSVFEKEFPDLKIESIKYHTAFRYLLSGGLTMKQLVPSGLFGLFTWLDRLLGRLKFSMFAYIIIRKA